MTTFNKSFIIILFIINLFVISASNRRQKKYPFDDYATYLGYPVETHAIQTQDGYILTYYRLQAQNSQIVTGKPVVYLQHGLLDASDTMILNDEYRAPGLMLANAGYDVWFGNSRGNFHSLKHIKYTTKQQQFWNFSLEDMGLKDLPAAFSYIHNMTAQQVNYIGHSQGVSIMLIALSQQVPSVVNLIGQFIALGPVAYFGTINSKPMKFLFKQQWMIKLYQAMGINSFGGPSQIVSSLVSGMCKVLPPLCQYAIQNMMDADPQVDNLKRMSYYMWHSPGGTSIKNMKHWIQLHDTNQFQQYDYGKEQNLQIYGSQAPPSFDLQQIQNNVHLFCGDSDLVADPIDVVRIFNEVKSSSSNATIQMYHSGHLSFMIGKDPKYMNDVFQILKD